MTPTPTIIGGKSQLKSQLKSCVVRSTRSAERIFRHSRRRRFRRRRLGRGCGTAVGESQHRRRGPRRLGQISGNGVGGSFDSGGVGGNVAGGVRGRRRRRRRSGIIAGRVRTRSVTGRSVRVSVSDVSGSGISNNPDRGGVSRNLIRITTGRSVSRGVSDGGDVDAGHVNWSGVVDDAGRHCRRRRATTTTAGGDVDDRRGSLSLLRPNDILIR